MDVLNQSHFERNTRCITNRKYFNHHYKEVGHVLQLIFVCQSVKQLNASA